MEAMRIMVQEVLLYYLVYHQLGNGEFVSCGSTGGSAYTNEYVYSGGGSGGGSINIFINSLFSNTCLFDASGYGQFKTTPGGKGTVTIGTIVGGYYTGLDI